MTAAAATEAPLVVDPRFAAVYAEHVDHVWRNLRRLGVSAPELDDAVQETFLVALRRWDDVREDVSWRAWLFGIARRVASHHRRGRARRLRLVGSVAHQVPRPSDLEDALALRDAARLVDHFLSTQPPRRREVFILAELEGFTGSEIAEALGINANTVGSRLRSARESFARFSSALQAREHGDRARADRRALLRGSQRELMSDASRERVMGMLALPIASAPASTATVVGVGWLGVIKAIALSVGIGAAMLGSVAGIAAVLRPAASTLPASDDATRQARAEASSHAAQPRTVVEPEAASSVASVEVPRLDPGAGVPAPEIAVRNGPADASTHAPERRRRAASTRASAASTSPVPAASPSPDAPADASALQAEFALAERIREATRAGEYGSVLELAAQHRRRFRNGELTVERDVHEIAALCGLGRDDQARARIAAFGAAHPGATVPAHVRVACGAEAQKSTTSTASGQQD